MEDKLQDKVTPNSQLIVKQVEEMIESAVKLERQTLREKIQGIIKPEYEQKYDVFSFNSALDSVLALIDNQENK